MYDLLNQDFDMNVRRYRFDAEFHNNGAITDWLAQRGVGWEPTTPYDHYENGVAERTHRTLRERTSAMYGEIDVTGRITDIITGKTEEFLGILKKRDGQQWVDNPTGPAECDSLWPEAMEHAVYLKNRAPARALRKREQKTPWEALSGVKPNLARERIFGSTAYVSFPPEKRGSKLYTPRAWYGWFVGCDGEAIYRIYSPDLKKVIRVG